MAMVQTPEPAVSAALPLREHSPLPQELAEIIDQVEREAASWRAELSVSIGQAQQMTGLKDSQIRYYEELEALQPRKAGSQSGSTRFFTIADIRRLKVLALLMQRGRRPAEAAELVRFHSEAVDVGAHKPITAIIRAERSAVTDGFFLARLISQIIEAAQTTLSSDLGLPTVRVLGALLPMRSVFPTDMTPAELVTIGDELLRAPADMLVALVEQSDPEALKALATPLIGTGSDSQTILFYSREPHTLGLSIRPRYCAYIPEHAPEQALLLLLECPDSYDPPTALRPDDPTRTRLLDTLLEICAGIAPEFRTATLAKNHRYRSDGFPLTITQASCAQLLRTICAVIFPGDEQALGALLVPNNLDRPESLSILASLGYDDELAKRARLDLRGDQGQGLSGRAFRLREPFLSLHAAEDDRVEYAIEEGSRQALAVPLATTWGLAPFGVLYLATRSDSGGLDSHRAYAALILGSILSEMLGRWWLTRLRKDLDATLHHRLRDIVAWLDGLDERGPDFQRGLAVIYALWCKAATGAKSEDFARKRLTIAVLDIDHYRHTVQARSNEPLPLQAQRHVCEALRRVDPHLRGYWFRNDHALLVLPDHDGPLAERLLVRIIDQVGLTPLKLPTLDGSLRSITVSAAYKELTYKALHDLGCGEAELQQKIGSLVRLLCVETRRDGASNVVALGPPADREPLAAVS